MNLEGHLARIVRDALQPMLAELEHRLLERLEGAGHEPVPEGQPDLMTQRELATYIRVSSRTVQRMLDELPAPIRVTPGRLLWRRSDIDTWLEERKAS